MANEEAKLWEKLVKAMSAAVELRIITQVGDVNVSGDLAKPTVTLGKGSAIATSINLVEGDITSVVPEEFLAPGQQVIRDFHDAQVEQAKAIVERNLRMIAEIGKQVVEAIKDLQQLESPTKDKP